MHVAVVAAPSAPLIDAATVRARLQLDASVVDATVEAYIAAAVARWDGPYATGDDALHRALGQWQLSLQAAHFPGQEHLFGDGYWDHPLYERVWHPLRHRRYILLPYPDIISVDGIAYIDPSGAQQTLDPSTYLVEGRRVSPAAGYCWPAVQWQPGAVQVSYTCGYDAGAQPPNPVPASLLQAIVLRVAQMNSMSRPDPLLKQDLVTGVGSTQYETSTDVDARYDRAVESLIASLRVYT